MIKAESPKPYYAQIKEYILYKIHSGELEPHDRIPSERSLSEQFGVSRLTVGKAIKELVLEGKLYTQIGKGTFVSEDPIDQTLDMLTSFSEEMERRGQHPRSEVVQQGIVPAEDPIAHRLHIPVGAKLVMLKRIRLANEQPVALETAYLIATYCEGILDRFNFARESLYEVLRTHYRLRLVHAEQEIGARPASTEETRMLHLDENSPILSMVRVTYIDDDHPVEYVESAYRGDRYKFRARLRNI